MTVKEFLKFIRYTPLYPKYIKEPQDSCGLTIVSFAKINNKQIHIEFSSNGTIYSECIDYTHYKEGDIISLSNNKIRKIIVDNAELNEETLLEISYKINCAIDDLIHDCSIKYNQHVIINYLEDILERMDKE